MNKTAILLGVHSSALVFEALRTGDLRTQNADEDPSPKARDTKTHQKNRLINPFGKVDAEKIKNTR